MNILFKEVKILMAKSGMTMQGIVAMAIGVLGLIIVYVVIPLIGSQMDQAVVLPASGTGSTWNSSVNTDVPTAVSLWTSLAGILKVAAFIVVIGGFLRTLQGMRA